MSERGAVRKEDAPAAARATQSVGLRRIAWCSCHASIIEKANLECGAGGLKGMTATRAAQTKPRSYLIVPFENVTL